MRRFTLVLAITAMAACGSPQPSEESGPPEPPPTAFDGALVTDVSARIAHGKRIADVLGCTGCHGAGLRGKRFYELYASNLTRDVRKYSDAALIALLREGVRPDRRDVWGMPSEIFQHLSEPDVAALVAYLRGLPPAGPPTQPRLPFEPETRKLIAEGKFKPAAAFVRDTRSLGPADLGPWHALGRYITRVSCAECHGPELKGNSSDTPDLIVVAAYSREEFERLMTDGTGKGNRKLKPLMAEVAKERVAHLTRHERDAVYAYLKARAEQPQ